MDASGTESLTVGNAGTLVAASLETAGQYIQSDFLNIIQGNAGVSVGALLYLISALVAFFMVAMGGNYRFWTYFLVAPGLFWFTVATRVETEGTKWTFGERVYDFSIIDSLFGEKILNYKGTEKPKVSWLFARWDEFTSSIVGFIVEKLPADQLEGDIKLIRQSQRYSTIHNLTLDNNDMSWVLSQLLYNKQCMEYLSLKMALHQEPKIFSDSVLNERIAAFDHAVVFTKNDPTMVALEKYIQLQAPRAFLRAAGGGILGSVGIITQIVNQISTIISGFTNCTSTSGTTTDPFAGLTDFFGTQEVEYTCPMLWDIAADMTASYAKVRVDTMIMNNLAMNEDKDDTNLSLKLLAHKFDYDHCELTGDISCFQNALRNMYRLIALRILNSHLTTINSHQLQHGLPNVGMTPSLPTDYSGVGQDIRYQAVEDEYSAKGQFLALLWGLPQFQAVILFFLSVSFPFFAFTFLLPGRHWSMGTWMSLWFWAKSWDVGFAFVMIADQILYYLLPRGPEIPDDIFYDPGEALYAVMRNDPNVPMSMYYSILASMLLAVPLITGFVVKRGATQLVGMIEGGLEQFSSSVGSAWGQSSRDANAKFRDQMSSSGYNLSRSALSGGINVGNTSSAFPSAGDDTRSANGTPLTSSATQRPPSINQDPSRNLPARPAIDLNPAIDPRGLGDVNRLPPFTSGQPDTRQGQQPPVVVNPSSPDSGVPGYAGRKKGPGSDPGPGGDSGPGWNNKE